MDCDILDDVNAPLGQLPMKILTLTDHRTHSRHESIYPLLREMAVLHGTEMWVASRGVPGNDDFFSKSGGPQVTASRVDAQFSYSPNGDWFASHAASTDARTFDGLFLRIDRPIDDSFLRSLSDRFADVKIVNNPAGIIETGGKDFLLRFQRFCAPSRLCRSIDDVLESLRMYPIVVKPLRSYGGKGLVRLSELGSHIGGTIATLEDALQEIERTIEKDAAVLAVKFLPTIDAGDKRIVVVNNVVLGAMLRFPAKGGWLANLSQGGTSILSDVTPEEYRMSDAISEVLIPRGVAVYGFDTLVNESGTRVLSEINTLNVGGFLQVATHDNDAIHKAATLVIDLFRNTNHFLT